MKKIPIITTGKTQEVFDITPQMLKELIAFNMDLDPENLTVDFKIWSGRSDSDVPRLETIRCIYTEVINKSYNV